MSDPAFLDEELSDLLGEQMTLRQFKEGEPIIKSGQKDVPFYVIQKGLCSVRIQNRDGGSIELDTLSDGMCFGEMSNITGSLTNANVIAMSDVAVYEISHQHFEDILQKVPPLARRLYIELARRLDNMNAMLRAKVDELLIIKTELEESVDDKVKKLKKNNEDLLQRNQELQHMQSSRDEFLNMAVHDLRSPLSNMMGFLEILGSDHRISGDEQLGKILEIVEKQSRGMLHLINDILDISKIHSGRLELELCQVHLDQLFEEAILSNQLIAHDKGMKIVVDCPDDTAAIKADPRRLLEVMNNLISNAIKYSDRGHTITLKAHDLKNGQVELSVQDEGQGIPEEDLPKLFTMFQQLTPRATEGEKGTGLGLAIVEKLVKLHEGRIDVKSQVGKGTTFIITLHRF